LVHYLALGGSGAPSATVRNLVLDDVGTRSVDGLGFTPGLVLAALGAGSGAGEPQPSLAAGFGAAARPGKQVAGAFVSQADAEQMVARGVQATDAFAVLPAATASGDIAVLSRLVSFDQDGFTLETTRLASELPLAALVLEEGSYAVGHRDGLRSGRGDPLRHRPHCDRTRAGHRTPVRGRLLTRSERRLRLVVHSAARLAARAALALLP
jgi:hypothetical protein